MSPLSGLLITQQHEAWLGRSAGSLPHYLPGLLPVRAPWCHPTPGEGLWMEVIYWWSLCLFSLPQLLAQLSAMPLCGQMCMSVTAAMSGTFGLLSLTKFQQCHCRSYMDPYTLMSN